MRTITSVLVAVAYLLISPTRGAHSAAARLRTSSADKRHVAEVRPRANGGEGVFVDDRLVWPKATARDAQIMTPVVWSRQGDAVALVSRDAHGLSQLVVAIVDGDAAGNALSWPIPPSALPARAVTWLGPTRVAAGPREMEPKVVASWTTTR